jgi:hypothetical protein
MKDRFKHSIFDKAEVREVLGLFAARNVRYLIFGGCAVMWYTRPRYTWNIDIWTASDPENARAVYGVLRDLGAPLAGMSPDDFCQPGFFYQMGQPPMRIDDMLSLRGVDFDEAWAEKEMVNINGVDVCFIGKRHLIAAKMAAGRPQDIVDVRHLVEDVCSSGHPA